MQDNAQQMFTQEQLEWLKNHLTISLSTTWWPDDELRVKLSLGSEVISQDSVSLSDLRSN